MTTNKKLKPTKFQKIKAPLTSALDRMFSLKPILKEGKMIDPLPVKSSDVKEIKKALKEPKPREKVMKCMHDILQAQKARQEEMTRLQKEYEHFRKRITQHVNNFGVTPLEKPLDKILYAAPYKAHLLGAESSGDFNEAAIRKAFPDLFAADMTVDLAQLDHALSKVGAPEAMRLMFKGYREQIESLQRQSGLTILKAQSEDMMDLERYEQMKSDGTITPEQIKIFETNKQVSFTLKHVEKLVDKPNRCEECGEPGPARKVEGHLHECKRCGHSS